jgi:restriction system protein
MAGQRGRVRHKRQSAVDEWIEIFAGAPVWLPVVFAGAILAVGVVLHWALLGLLGALVVLCLGLGGLSERRRRQRLVALAGSLESLRRLPWADFERLVAEAYRRRGYSVELTGGGGIDGGVDLVLRDARRSSLVQCKQWKRQVGVTVVRELAGVMHVEKASAGVLVATEGCTREAIDFARHAGIELIDGPGLLALLNLNPGAVVDASQPAAPASVTQTSGALPCPLCGAAMVPRQSHYGPFWGCANFPRCRGKRVNAA